MVRKKARRSPPGILITTFQLIGALPCRLLLKILGGYAVRTRITGKLDPTQVYVVAANHQSMLDPFAIFALMPRRYRRALMPIKFMTRPTIFHKPYLKPFLWVLGSFPAHIKHRNYHTYGVEGSIKLLNQGYTICIFPEGKRTLRHESRGRSGISRILQGVPDAKLVLVRIDWSVKGWRRHVKITIAEPPQNLDSQNPRAIMEAIYSL